VFPSFGGPPDQPPEPGAMDMAQLTKHHERNGVKSSAALFKALLVLLALITVGACIEFAWNSYRVTTGPSGYFVQAFGTGRSGWHGPADSVIDGPFARNGSACPKDCAAVLRAKVSIMHADRC
jgi:hypothetical protein